MPVSPDRLAAAADPKTRLLGAACVGMDVDAFFPESQTAKVNSRIDVCHTCPVIDACLDTAMSRETKTTAFGIAGGLFEEQRKEVIELSEQPGVDVEDILSKIALFRGQNRAFKSSSAPAKRVTRKYTKRQLA